MTTKIDPFTGFLGPPPLTTATTPQTSVHACCGLVLAAAATTTTQQPHNPRNRAQMLGFGGCWTAATANHPHNPSNEHSRLLWACSGRRRHHDNPPTPHNPRNQARMLGFSGCWIAATANHPHNPSNECSHLLWASSGPQPIHSPPPP